MGIFSLGCWDLQARWLWSLIYVSGWFEDTFLCSIICLRVEFGVTFDIFAFWFHLSRSQCSVALILYHFFPFCFFSVAILMLVTWGRKGKRRKSNEEEIGVKIERGFLINIISFIFTEFVANASNWEIFGFHVTVLVGDSNSLNTFWTVQIYSPHPSGRPFKTRLDKWDCRWIPADYSLQSFLKFWSGILWNFLMQLLHQYCFIGGQLCSFFVTKETVCPNVV